MENENLENEIKKKYYKDSVKKAIDNYRINHKEKFREYANKKALDYYYLKIDKYKAMFKERNQIKKDELLKKYESGELIRPKRGRPRKNI